MNTFQQRDLDLARLYGLAISNTSIDPKKREQELAEFREHKQMCIDKYGIVTTCHAITYGWELSRKEND